MAFLRTASIHRLLISLFAAIVTCLGCTAIALAASSGGSVPPKASLASAIHGALAGPGVSGVYARVSFTNNLFSGSSIETNDPLITGTSGRLWASPGHLRVELDSTNGDAEIVVSGQRFWAYDPTSNTVYEGALPQDPTATGASVKHRRVYTYSGPPSVAQIQSRLNQLTTHVNVSAAKPTNIGGQPAYSVTLSPKTSKGLLGAVRIGFDAKHAVPLDFAIIPRGSSTPALELKATSISYGPGAVSPSDFVLSPPKGAHVVQITPPQPGATGGSATGGAATTTGHPGSVRVLGHGLSSVIVAQGPAHGAASMGSGPAGPLPLQHVKINGATGRQLATSLGTVLEFTSNGVSHLLAGSVTPTTLDAVARGL